MKLFINLQRLKNGKFSSSVGFIRDKTIPATQHHAVSMARKTCELRECPESRNPRAFGRRIDLKFKKLKGLFSRRGIRRIRNQEI